MSEPIRVMHVMGHMMGGGVEATVMNHYRHIDRTRVQFDFVVDSDSTVVPREEIETLGGRVFVVPPYKRLPRYLRACEALFREQRPDIVHSNVNALSVFPLAAAKKAGVPIRIAHSHSTAAPGEIAKNTVKNILRPWSRVFPTHLAACSEVAGRWLFGDRAVDEGRVRIIKNAIDLERFSYDSDRRAGKRQELGIAEDQLVVGQVGRLCFQKNQLFTLDVFAEVLKHSPDAVLILVGDGPMRGEIEKKVSDLGIGASVRLLGIRSDTADLYQAFDVLMFPSRYEGLGIAAVEAQAAGLSVLASDFVPQEVRIISNLVSFLPIHDWDISQWVNNITNCTRIGQNTNPQADAMGMIRLAGYDIEQSSAEIIGWYEQLVSQERK